jgi:hypothetical protein
MGVFCKPLRKFAFLRCESRGDQPVQRHDASEPEARRKWLTCGRSERPSRRRQSAKLSNGFRPRASRGGGAGYFAKENAGAEMILPPAGVTLRIASSV